jgi:hypothetical protein
MPYKSEKIIISGSKYDRRCKLSAAQRAEIISLRGTISQRKCAEKYGVSRRTIQFLWFPEKLEANRKALFERGGWKQYYKKEEWSETMRNHRRYKQSLYMKGLIA